jgi:DNA-damage-inducible protein J
MTMEVQAIVDEQLGQKAEAIFAEVGLTVSDVLSMLMRRTVEDHAVPLDLLKPNSETLEAMEDARAGRNMISAANIDDLFAQLHAED